MISFPVDVTNVPAFSLYQNGVSWEIAIIWAPWFNSLITKEHT